jgi:hypothetical protein
MWNGSTPLPACGERVPKAGEGRQSRCVSRLHNAFEAGVARIRPAAASGERGADRSRCPGCAALTRATRLPTGGEKAWVCSPCARVMRRGESPRLRASLVRRQRENPRMRTRKVRHRGGQVRRRGTCLPAQRFQVSWQAKKNPAPEPERCDAEADSRDDAARMVYMEQKSLAAKENCLDVEEHFLEGGFPGPRREDPDVAGGPYAATDVAPPPAIPSSRNS